MHPNGPKQWPAFEPKLFLQFCCHLETAWAMKKAAFQRP